MGGQTRGTRSGRALAAGSYLVRLDAQGCDTSGTVTVEPGERLDVLVDVEIEACEGTGALASIRTCDGLITDSATVLLGGAADEVTSSGTSASGPGRACSGVYYRWTALAPGRTRSLRPGKWIYHLELVRVGRPAGVFRRQWCRGGLIGKAAPFLWRGLGRGVRGRRHPDGDRSGFRGALPRGAAAGRRHRLSRVLLRTDHVEAESNGLAVGCPSPSPVAEVPWWAGSSPRLEACRRMTSPLGAVDSLSLPFLVPGTYPFALTDFRGVRRGRHHHHRTSR